MINSPPAPTDQDRCPVRGVMDNEDLVRKILQKLKTPELGKSSPTSILFNNESNTELLSRRQPFLDVLKILKDDKAISKKLFNRKRKNNTFLKSPTPIGCETFLNYQNNFREIATKIKTMIETQQDTNPKIKRTQLNNLKNKFLKYLIINPGLIGKIDLDKVRFYKTSKSYYLGEFNNEKANGYGTKTYANGDTYTGGWKDEKHHGDGTLTSLNGFRYEGEWKDGKRHGWGTFTDKNGNRHEGEWKDGILHGWGECKYANGDKYEGDWKDNKHDGWGKETCSNGDSYDGEWKNGERHGWGTLTYADGASYVGEFLNGQRHGRGTCEYADGASYVGKFKNETYHGHGICTWANGNRYEGDWEMGYRHGTGTYTLKKGGEYVGGFKDGNRHGWGKEIFCHGTYLGGFREGQRDGYGKLTFVNGNVYEGLWQNGHGVNVVLIGKVISPQDPKGLRRRGPALQGCELERPIKLSDMELQELNIILDSKNNSIKKQTWMSIADVASIFKNPKINREKLKQE